MQLPPIFFLLQQLASVGFATIVSISPQGDTAQAPGAVVRRAQEVKLWPWTGNDAQSSMGQSRDETAAENGFTSLASLSANDTRPAAVRKIAKLEKQLRSGQDKSGFYLKAVDFRNIKFYAINVTGGVQRSKYIEKKFGVHVDPIDVGSSSWMQSFRAGWMRSPEIKDSFMNGDMLLQEIKGFEKWRQAPPEVEWFVRFEDDAVVDDTLLTEIQYIVSMRPDARVIWLDKYHQHCGHQAGKEGVCGSDLESAMSHTANAMFHRTVIPHLLEGYDYANETSYVNRYIEMRKEMQISEKIDPEEFLGSLVTELKISSAKHGIVKHRTAENAEPILETGKDVEQQEGPISTALNFSKVGFYVINLARSTDRFGSFRDQFVKLGIGEPSRVEAVDAKASEDDPSDLEELDRKIPMCLPRGKRNIGYKGLYLSEFKSYADFLKAPSDIEWFVRFEDDAMIDEHLLVEIQYITTMRPEARVIWLDKRSTAGIRSLNGERLPSFRHCGELEPPCSYQMPGRCCHAGIMFHRDILSRLLKESDQGNPGSFINHYGEVDHFIGKLKDDHQTSSTTCLNDWYLPHVVSHLQIPATSHGVVGGSMQNSTIHKGSAPASPLTCTTGEKLFITSHKKQQLQDRDGSVSFGNNKDELEKWTLSDAGDGKVFITSHRGEQLSDNKGSLEMSPRKLDWQKFTMKDAGNGKVLVTSHQETHLQHVHDQSVLSKKAGDWEAFEVTDASGANACRLASADE